MKKHRRLSLFIIVFFLYSFFIMHHMMSNPNAKPPHNNAQRNITMNNKPSNNNNSNTSMIQAPSAAFVHGEKIISKTILLWNLLPGKMSSVLGTGRDGLIRMGCEITDCYVTNDGSGRGKPIHSYDAVVFNINVLHYSAQLPWLVPNYSRNKSQIFVFLSQEPPM
jgi:hypothetical protein